MKLAFVANFDAELELADPAYAPSSRMAASMALRAEAFVAQLGQGVAVLVPGRPNRLAGVVGASGLCWCPTPSALRLLAEVGAHGRPAPTLDVLQTVNHRAFASALVTLPPEAAFVRTLDDLDRRLASLPPPTPVVLKRPFGFAGRGRKVRPTAAPLTGADRRWAAASMTQYGCGLMVEPWRTVRLDLALHGAVHRGGGHTLGAPTVQENDTAGAWLRSRLVAPGELAPVESDELLATGARTARALAAAGYFGPFGIDAYRWVDARGESHFQPLSDLNARLTMGWCVGMGGTARRVLLDEA